MDDPNAHRPQQQHEKRAPIYELGKDGHYGACQQIAASGNAPNPDVYTGPWVNINNGLQNQYREVLSTYWQATLRRLEDDDHDYKVHQLPLARIKKVMKADADVKMISAEAPILFAKGCDIFITELTMRAWIHAEENKRRTLQRSDIAAALAKSDMYDFLIDIVPREEAGPANQKRPSQASQANQQSIPPQVPQQMGGPHHHAPPQEYAGYPGHLAGEQEFRGPPMYAPQDQAYGHPPPGMFEQNMYNQYQMPAPQMYQIPPRPHEPPSGPPAHHHYRPHEAVEAEVDHEGERDYEVN